MCRSNYAKKTFSSLIHIWRLPLVKAYTCEKPKFGAVYPENPYKKFNFMDSSFYFAWYIFKNNIPNNIISIPKMISIDFRIILN